MAQVAQKNIDKVLSEVDGLIVNLMNEHMAGGLAVGIVHEGKLVYAKGFGVADQRKHIPVTPDTVFRIGSISKTFTAIGIMQLWEQGKLQIDDPINQYLKHYKFGHPDPAAPPVTFRHIFTHNTGLGDLLSLRDLLPGAKSIAVKPGDTRTPAQFYTEGIKTELYPGVKWSYDNHAYGTLGQIIEDVTGQRFGDYMIESVFKPLGMMKSDYYRSERVRDMLAEGYASLNGPLQPVKYTDIVVPGAGSIFSSVNEMAKYMAALMNGGANEHGSVIKPETLDMMMTPNFQLDPRLPAMGLTFWLEWPGGYRVAWHGGGWPGFISLMMVAPEEKVGVMAFTNGGNRSSWAAGGELMRRLLDIAPEAIKLPRPGIEAQPHLWGDLCGVYEPAPGFSTNGRVWASYGGGIEIGVKGSQLMFKGIAGALKGGIPLYPADKEDPLAFQVEAPAGALWTPALVQPNWVVFKRGSDGAVDRLTLGFLTFYKQPVFKSNVPDVDNTVNAAVTDLRRRRGAVVAWYLNRMPNKLKAAQYVLTRLVALFIIWRLLRRARRG